VLYARLPRLFGAGNDQGAGNLGESAPDPIRRYAQPGCRLLNGQGWPANDTSSDRDTRRLHALPHCSLTFLKSVAIEHKGLIREATRTTFMPPCHLGRSDTIQIEPQ
jgi:hypothetical protein